LLLSVALLYTADHDCVTDAVADAGVVVVNFVVVVVGILFGVDVDVVGVSVCRFSCYVVAAGVSSVIVVDVRVYVVCGVAGIWLVTCPSCCWYYGLLHCCYCCLLC